MICMLYQYLLLLRNNLSTCNYRFPSQTPDEFENYCQNCIKKTLSKIDDHRFARWLLEILILGVETGGQEM